MNIRLGKIFPKNLVHGQKRDQNPTITRYVFMNFKVQKSEFSMSGPFFVYFLTLWLPGGGGGVESTTKGFPPDFLIGISYENEILAGPS